MESPLNEGDGVLFPTLSYIFFQDVIYYFWVHKLKLLKVILHTTIFGFSGFLKPCEKLHIPHRLDNFDFSTFGRQLATHPSLHVTDEDIEISCLLFHDLLTNVPTHHGTPLSDFFFWFNGHVSIFLISSSNHREKHESIPDSISHNVIHFTLSVSPIPCFKFETNS